MKNKIQDIIVNLIGIIVSLKIHLELDIALENNGIFIPSESNILSLFLGITVFIFMILSLISLFGSLGLIEQKILYLEKKHKFYDFISSVFASTFSILLTARYITQIATTNYLIIDYNRINEMVSEYYLTMGCIFICLIGLILNLFDKIMELKNN